jgi:hypothetical protein
LVMCVLRSLLVWPLAVVLLSGAASIAFAQEAADDGLRTDTLVDDETVATTVPEASRITIGDDENVVARRPRSSVDPYAQQGIDTGAFLFLPSLEVSSVVASNAARSSTDADTDVGLRLRPTLRWESEWSRHSFSGSASANTERFLKNDDLKTVGADVSAAARIDIRRTTRADLTAQYALTSTGTENSGVPATADGKRLDQSFGVGAGVTHDFGGVDGGLRLAVQRNVFGALDLTGGGTEDNSDRDYTELTVAARASLRTGGIIQPFGEVAYVPRFFDKRQDRNGTKRNSQGLRLAVGTVIADDPLWTGDIALTFDVRDYEDSSLRTTTSPGIAANVIWRPTDLTRFEFNSGASLAETIAAGESATKTWTAGVTGTHELRENLDVTAGLGFTLERAAGETSTTTTGKLGVNWEMNPYLVWGASYEGTWFNGRVAASDYTDHRLLTSVIIRR